jgi:chaperonin GroEL
MQVGTISANGEEKIGILLAKAMSIVGRDGVITVEEAKGFETTLNIVDGVRLERGYLSPYFINDKQKSIVELDEPYVLVTNRKIKSMQEILPILEEVHKSQKGLLIIADEIEGEAMQALVVNALRGTLRVCAIRAPGLGEYRYAFLDDLAALLGTKILTPGDDDLLKTFTVDDLGSCKRASITRTHTTLVECAGRDDDVKARLREIIRRASNAPLSQIVRNSGGSPEVVIDKVINAEHNIGYDAKRGEMADMFSAGIVDPVKVVRCAIQNAGSSAAMMLTVGCVMIEEDTV